MNFDNFTISLNGSPFLFLLFAIFAVGYTVFIYKYTVPQISFFLKSLLILIRASIVVLLLLLLFEPTLNLIYTKSVEPETLIFIDNSSSIIEKDSLERSKKISELLNKINDNIDSPKRFFSFGKYVKPISDITKPLPFNEHITNFQNITRQLLKEKNVSSVLIISDGIINDGSNSYNFFEKYNKPIFTVAVGDTVEPIDLKVEDVLFNKFIYKNKSTEIEATLYNHNLAEKRVTASLVKGGNIIASKVIKLDKSGINKVRFEFTPSKIGRENLSVKVSKISGETTFGNNEFPFSVTVLKDKIVVSIISDSPTNDLSALIKSIRNNKSVRLNKFIKTKNSNSNRFTNNKIDSTDIFLFINFPTNSTSNKSIQKIKATIEKNSTPFFISLSENISYNRLKSFGDILPFNINQSSRDAILITPQIVEQNTGILPEGVEWQGLPPIYTNFSELSLNQNCRTLAIGNSLDNSLTFPLLFTSRVGNRRTIVLNGFNFWKWRLNSNVNSKQFFDRFIANAIKWLNANKIKNRVTVKPGKNIYKSNESIKFISTVYDETLAPIDNAEVKVKISAKNFNSEIKLQNIKEGNYEGKIDILFPGDYTYVGIVNIPGEEKKVARGKFTINNYNLENNNFVLNSNYLNFISDNSSAKSFVIENYSGLINRINNLSKQNRRIYSKKEVFNLWEIETILYLIIFLFSLEWFLRKFNRLL